MPTIGTRKIPTKKHILDYTGNNGWVLSQLHHGIDEQHDLLAHLYPYMNLEEIIVFVAESFKLRDADDASRVSRVQCGATSLYDIIYSAHASGYSRIRAGRDNAALFEAADYLTLNPFSTAHGSLADRISAFEGDHGGIARQLLQNLSHLPPFYAFEGVWDSMPTNSRRKILDSRQVKLMTFQNMYPPKKGDGPGIQRMKDKYALEITRIMMAFPKEVYTVTGAETWNPQDYEQGTLI